MVRQEPRRPAPSPGPPSLPMLSGPLSCIRPCSKILPRRGGLGGCAACEQRGGGSGAGSGRLGAPSPPRQDGGDSWRSPGQESTSGGPLSAAPAPGGPGHAVGFRARGLEPHELSHTAQKLHPCLSGYPNRDNAAGWQRRHSRPAHIHRLTCLCSTRHGSCCGRLRLPRVQLLEASLSPAEVVAGSKRPLLEEGAGGAGSGGESSLIKHLPCAGPLVGLLISCCCCGKEYG